MRVCTRHNATHHNCKCEGVNTFHLVFLTVCVCGLELSAQLYINDTSVDVCYFKAVCVLCLLPVPFWLVRFYSQLATTRHSLHN